jgi:ketosteroid isomerase-like protein
MAEKPDSVKSAYAALLAAIQRLGLITARANFLDGYRAGNTAREDELFQESQGRWRMVGEAEAGVVAALRRYARALKRAATKGRDAKRAVTTVGAKRRKQTHKSARKAG